MSTTKLICSQSDHVLKLSNEISLVNLSSIHFHIMTSCLVYMVNVLGFLSPGPTRMGDKAISLASVFIDESLFTP